MESAPINVWTEMRATSEGISITLYSEWRGISGDPTKVEDEAWYTHTELEAMSGEGALRSDLNLSQSTQDRLSSLRSEANDELDMFTQPDTNQSLPEVGDILIDKNAPEWSGGEAVKVVEVLENASCDEYLIDGLREGEAIDPSLHSRGDKTVADANPSYDESEPVVIGRYGGDGGWSGEYAFPASRLGR